MIQYRSIIYRSSQQYAFSGGGGVRRSTRYASSQVWTKPVHLFIKDSCTPSSSSSSSYRNNTTWNWSKKPSPSPELNPTDEDASKSSGGSSSDGNPSASIQQTILSQCSSLHSSVMPLNSNLSGPLAKNSDRGTSLPFVFLVGNHSSGKSSFVS